MILLLALAACGGGDEVADGDAPASTRAANPVHAPAPVPVAISSYVGDAHCAGCHAEEVEAWQGSHHDLAMQAVSADTVLGNFDDAEFHHNGVTSTFFRRGDDFFVRTDGPEGELQEYPLVWVFGVYPLQQYLVEFPGGRLQALSLSWDARPADEGGQRWFHLYQGREVDHEHALHWTAPSQNWNFMCAECHSTNLRKGYDAAADRYETTWSQIDVGCEACHGPASRHLAWAQGERTDDDPGLVVRFDERAGARWHFEPGAVTAVRSAPRYSAKEISVCARCHSRRGVLSEDFVPGAPIGDTHRVALLTPELYHSDGQPADETYVYGSFLQSRMFHQGVTCSDCHQPHSLALRADGDQVCASCHRPDHFASEAHHFHPPDSAGASCVGCHMPAQDFMVVDTRLDHSFRIPRPDLSVELGVPNTCNQCHSERSDEWAADTVEHWYGEPAAGFQAWAPLLDAARPGDPAVRERLLVLVQDPAQAGIARATAVQLLGRDLNEASAAALARLADDSDPLIRRAVAEAFEAAPPELRARVLGPGLLDPVRDVRIAAARGLAGSGLRARSGGVDSDPLGEALAEYMAAQRLNADRPESQLNLALVHLARRDVVKAERAYRQALALDADFVPATINLADLYRATGRDEAAGDLLRRALQDAADDPSLNHSYGLWLVRQQRLQEGVPYLQRASKNAPDNPRYAYVHALALQGVGDTDAAIDALEQLLEKHSFDRPALEALRSLYREQGHEAQARTIDARLAQFD